MPGRPGQIPEAHAGLGMPLSLAGLVRGGWGIEDAVTSWAAPAPGLVESQVPLAWADSAAVVFGEDAAWQGFGFGIAHAQTFMSEATRRTPRAVWTYVSGSSALERISLFLSRSDSRHWLRVGSAAQRRGGMGELNLSGEHVWALDGGLRRANQTYRARFTQRGMGASLAYPLRESGRSESGDIGHDWASGKWRSSLTLERGWDARESSDATFGSTFPVGRRDAQQARFLAALTRTRGDNVDGVRVWARQGLVVRQFSGGTRTAWDERAAWVAARIERPWQGGTLGLQLGGGFSDAAGRPRERGQLSPGVTWRYADERVRLKLFAERVVDPIWSDLAAGVQPFVQDTWLAGMQAGTGSTKHWWVDSALMFGRTGNRAVLAPYPLRDVQLRIGYEAESRGKEIVLATLEGGARARIGSLEASAYGLSRDRDGQRWVDPAAGARLAVESGFRVFAGDLGIRLRLESAYVGARETDIGRSLAGQPYPEQVLPAYNTLAGSVALTLGDGTLVVRVDGLEDVRRPQAWLDLITGLPALGAGRQMRAQITWPFFN